MKCPKCGYHSFDHLDSCNKCGGELVEHKTKFNLRGFYSVEQANETSEAMQEETELSENSAAAPTDFGFDFLEEQESDATPPGADLGAVENAAPPGQKATIAGDGISLEDDSEFSLDQPFGVDGENVPADDQSGSSSGNKSSSDFSL